ncbi:hypothetical protein [Ectothiorhodospira lacustris]|uniref:hypothetical protein n=1 Tax=Ectothiorhodospira lacustris TaxID=2899127 RepID=UPI001EE9705D|nr:hypothetical protein [Ectothiorhodospira lacustris]MCG5508764.1 hypothetical protein [Ectothiorhodospira lacustris]MCG5520555.1 hypothetical protein [Ectothiorhodospira lacustris]
MLNISRDLFESFMRTAVIGGAFSNEERTLGTGPLAEKTQKDITSGKRIDHRTPYLCRVSGKGGHVEGPSVIKRLQFRNVSLLDHLVSVARGACVFAELDLRAMGVSEDRIRPRLAILIAVGFLHDADKILGRERVEEITSDDIAQLLQRYRIDEFLKASGVEISPEDLLSMIHGVEVSRSGSLRSGMRLLSAEEAGDCHYARLADRLEGLFLNSEAGLEALIKELEKFGGFRSQVFSHGWRAVTVRSAHTPFLLNALQRGLSAATQNLTSMPPLIEVHHDGEFLAVIPESAADQIIDAALARATRPLRLGMRVMTNPKGTRNILDGGSGPEDLLDLLARDPGEASKALFLHVDLLTGQGSLREQIDTLLTPMGLPPDYAGLNKFGGKHYQAWPCRGDDNEILVAALRRDAAAIAVGLGCAEPDDKKLASKVPDSTCRESELLEVIRQSGQEVPEWLLDVGHKLSRQTLLSALAAGLAERDEDLRERVFGFEGLLHLWLCGDGEERAGLLAKLGDPGAAFIDAAMTWLRGCMKGQFLSADETAGGRCHFTNIPVGLERRIDTKSGLDGIKTSAFSGREGRPESYESSRSQTLVSPAAAAEHRLRTLMGEGRSGEVPAYISSPTMMGLFASLNMKADADFLQINHYDLMRQEIKPGKTVWPEAQTYGQRIMFARHVTIPAKTEEVIALARMMMQSALRLSRPVHVFKGLPTPENAYVHFDFLPGAVERGIGGRSLRLEQIPDAIDRLRILEQMIAIPNLGLEVTLRYADPATRFAAACEALAVINRLPEDKQKQLAHLKMTLKSIVRSPDTPMTSTDNVLIDFARAMTRVQAAPSRNASNSERTLGLKVALDAIESCAGEIHQTGTETLIAAIAGGLENEFERSSRLAWRGKDKGLHFPRKAAFEAATLFVEKVWPIAFQSRPPASKARRIALAVYQVAFENESYRKREQAPDATTPEQAEL